MSVQFGKANFDGKPVDPEDLNKVRPMVEPYGPDAEGYLCRGNFAVLYRAFHTTTECRREVQPYVLGSGAILTWDGRLDNREELISLLAGGTSASPSDLEIVGAAYVSLGTQAFSKLIGDWALSIWDPTNQFLLLAKDFLGIRHLYYSMEKNGVAWCSILDPLVLCSGRSFKIHEEYIAGWLSFFPAPDLTPYVGIQAVPPSSFVCLKRESVSIGNYWDFDSSKQLHYRSDSEYEEHFRTIFASSVRRRLRSGVPVLAELSGGMDSSSIVCVADLIMKTKQVDAPRLDTISYYDDSEPNWNEKPYFGAIEQKRSRIGCHIDASSNESSAFSFQNRFVATPNQWATSPKLTGQLADLMKAQGNRVILSGIGGDEVTGGVPTPVPELADLLARIHLATLLRQLTAWALVKRKPLFHILFDIVREFLPHSLIGLPAHLRPAPWLHKAFVERQQSAFSGYRSRLRLSKSLPSFQENIATTDLLRRQLACEAPSPEYPFEFRYPFLDRDLLEFMFAIPRPQIIRPGERRSLMRRSLTGIVPDAILNRKRKAFVTRSLMTRILKERSSLAGVKQDMEASSLKFIDAQAFLSALDESSRGKETNLVAVMRTLALEYWLRNANDLGVAKQRSGLGRENVAFEIQASGFAKDSAS